MILDITYSNIAGIINLQTARPRAAFTAGLGKEQGSPQVQDI